MQAQVFMNPSFIFDIICLAAWLLLAIHYARQGFLAALMRVAGNLLSLVGANMFAQWASPLLFQRFLAGNLQQSVLGSLAGGATDIAALVARYAGFLPESVRASLVEAFERSLSNALADDALQLANAIVQDVIRPLITPVLSIMLFFIAFALCRMLASLLVAVLGLVNHLPVLGTVNRGLGFAVGGVAGLVDLFIALCVVWAAIAITGGDLPLLNDQALGASICYRLFNTVNPFI